MKMREKAQAGMSAYATGKEMRVSKNTARKYIDRPDEAAPRAARPLKLDKYKPYLHELMGSGIFTA